MKQRSIWILTFVAILILAAVISCAPVVPAARSTRSGAPTAGRNMPASPTGAPRQGSAGQRINGAIASMDATTITVGNTVIGIGAGTTVQKTVQGAPADLQPGQFLDVRGAADASGAIAATSIAVRPQPTVPQDRPTPTPRATPPATLTGPPNTAGLPGRSGGGTAGGLSKIDGNTLTLSSGQTTITVIVSPATVIQETVAGTLADLHAGDSVNVLASRDSSGNLTATGIEVIPPGQP